MQITSKKTQLIATQNNLNIAVYQWGESNPQQETIVLLHGYPDSASVWDQVAEVLSASFHVVSYDVRGTGLSDIPRRQKEYKSDYLINDLEQVISLTSPNKRVHLISYDWGSLQAWEGILGDRIKPKVISFTAMTPSLDAIGWWFHSKFKQKSLKSYIRMMKRLHESSYMLFFQLPVIPELTWRAGLHRLWPKIVTQIQKYPAPHSPTMLKDALHSIALYRVNMIKPFFRPSKRKTTIPTQMIMLSQAPFVPEDISRSMSNWAEQIEFTEI